MIIGIEGDDRRVNFRVYVKKRSCPSWMSANLLLRKFCLDNVVVWYQTFENDVWFV